MRLTAQAVNVTDIFDNRRTDMGGAEIEESKHKGRQLLIGVKYSS